MDSNLDTAATTRNEGSSFDYWDALVLLGDNKWLMAGIIFFSTAMAVVFTLVVPARYTAETLIMPPQQSQPGASATLAALAGAAASVPGVSAKTPEALYVEMLKSETIQNEIIKDFKLLEHYHVDLYHDARLKLDKFTKVSPDKKSGLIRLEFTHSDSEGAAQIANAHVTQLRHLLTRISVTEAQQRKIFYEDQIAKIKDALTHAELKIWSLQQKSGTMNLDAQTQSSIAAIGSLRAQLVSIEVQIQSKRAYATENNPDLKKLINEYSSVKNQLHQLESGHGKVTNVSEASNFSGIRAYRELKFQEALYAVMLQQYHNAVSDAAKEAPLVQQIDVALPPERRSFPKRTIIVITVFLLACFLAVAYVLLKSAWLRSMNMPEITEKRTRVLKAWCRQTTRA